METALSTGLKANSLIDDPVDPFRNRLNKFILDSAPDITERLSYLFETSHFDQLLIDTPEGRRRLLVGINKDIVELATDTVREMCLQESTASERSVYQSSSPDKLTWWSVIKLGKLYNCFIPKGNNKNSQYNSTYMVVLSDDIVDHPELLGGNFIDYYAIRLAHELLSNFEEDRGDVDITDGTVETVEAAKVVLSADMPAAEFPKVVLEPALVSVLSQTAEMQNPIPKLYRILANHENNDEVTDAVRQIKFIITWFNSLSAANSETMDIHMIKTVQRINDNTVKAKPKVDTQTVPAAKEAADIDKPAGVQMVDRIDLFISELTRAGDVYIDPGIDVKNFAVIKDLVQIPIFHSAAQIRDEIRLDTEFREAVAPDTDMLKKKATMEAVGELQQARAAVDGRISFEVIKEIVNHVDAAYFDAADRDAKLLILVNLYFFAAVTQFVNKETKNKMVGGGFVNCGSMLMKPVMQELLQLSDEDMVFIDKLMIDKMPVVEVDWAIETTPEAVVAV